jgi:hypothetical protein
MGTGTRSNDTGGYFIVSAKIDTGIEVLEYGVIVRYVTFISSVGGFEKGQVTDL